MLNEFWKTIPLIIEEANDMIFEATPDVKKL
jgi:hypothetical protein